MPNDPAAPVDAPRPPKPPMLLANLAGTWTWMMRGDDTWHCHCYEAMYSHEIKTAGFEVDRDASDARALKLYDADTATGETP